MIQNDFLHAEVEAETLRRVSLGESFTALQISRAVQAGGVRERHRFLKETVHELFARGGMPGYDRTPVLMPCGGRPFLYHPCQPGTRFATAPQRDAHQRTLDRWSRLRVPASQLRAAGFAPGDTVIVERDAARGVVRLSADGMGSAYRVDRYGIVRLTIKRTLASASVLFKLESASGEVRAEAI